MHIQSAASAVLNAAAPGGGVAGLVAGGAAAGDALSPFSGILENLLQPGAFGALSSVQDGAATPTLAANAGALSALTPSRLTGSAKDDASATLAAQPTTLTASASSLTPKAPSKAAPGDLPSTLTAPSDDEDAPIASPTILLSAAAQPRSGAVAIDASASTPSSKSKPAKATQDQDDARQTEVQPVSLPLAAFVAPPPVAPGTKGQDAPTGSLAKADATAPLPASVGTDAPSPKADAQPTSQNQSAANQTNAGQTASTDGQAQASAGAAPTAPGEQRLTLPVSQTAQAQPPAAAPPPATAQPTSTQQPSAVAQFTGRSRPGAPSTAGGFRAASASGRASTSPSSGTTGVWSASLGPTDAKASVAAASSQDFDVATTASDAQSSDQDAQTSGQDATPAAAQSGDAGTLSTLAATVQIPPSNDVASGVRTASETVANLSAQIAQKAGGQTTRFDVQLDPIGLGRVNVSVEIDAKGAMSAALSFEKPESASLLKSHSAELQQSLTQAGFDLSNANISFSTAEQDGRGGQSQTAFLGAGADGSGGQQSQGGQSQNAGRAFGAASFAAEQADQINSASRSFSARGLDIRI